MGLRLFRGANIEARIRGSRIEYRKSRLACEEELANDTDCQQAADSLGVDVNDAIANGVGNPGTDGWDVSGILSLSFSNMSNIYGIQSGTRFKLRYERGIEELGSDWDFWMTEAQLTTAFAALLLKKDNLVFRTKAGYGERLPFHQEYVAGGVALRGYKARQFRGDMRIAGNAEYSLQILNIKGVALRLIGFYDCGIHSVCRRPGRRSRLP